uniref:Uncharacterized protein n=1 Tax=Leersia perrieri TaxID=77586 RepID=A0A0D9X4B5_9ORYZ
MDPLSPSLACLMRPSCDDKVSPRENKSLDLSPQKCQKYLPYDAAAVSASDRDHVTSSPRIPVGIAVALPFSTRGRTARWSLPPSQLQYRTSACPPTLARLTRKPSC